MSKELITLRRLTLGYGWLLDDSELIVSVNGCEVKLDLYPSSNGGLKAKSK
jgi:hypothetical protein